MSIASPILSPTEPGFVVESLLRARFTLTRGVADYAAIARQVLSPAEAEDIWKWCCKHLMMPDGQRWSPKRAKVMRKWYRLVQARLTGMPDPTDPVAHLCEQLWIACATQIAKTTFLHDIALWMLRNAPRRSALYMGRGADLKDNRKFRMELRLQKMPVLTRLLPTGDEARALALGSRTWTVGTALLFWLNANVVDDTRSGDYSLIFGDELERWGDDVGGFGDPVESGIGRQRTYPRSRLFLAASSPGLVSSHTWRRVAKGASHERLMAQCAACSALDWMNPAQICLAGKRPFEDTPPSLIVSDQLARWACRFCGVMHNGETVHRMIDEAVESERWCPGKWEVTPEHPQGHWTPHAELQRGTDLILKIHPTTSIYRSAQISSLFSQDVTLDSFAAMRANAIQGTAMQRKVFTNNEEAHPSFSSVIEADTDEIKLTTKSPVPYNFGHGLPHRAPWLMLFFDQQGNHRSEWWFPWNLRAFMPGGESWLVSAGSAMSVAERDQVERTATLIGGHAQLPTITGMDCANGHFLFDAYLWASDTRTKRVLVRGDGRIGRGTPWLETIDQARSRRRTPKPAGVREWRVHPHFWRDELWDRLRGLPSAGGVHRARWWLPDDAPDWYLNSLTSQERVPEKRRGPGGFITEMVWRPRVIESTTDKVSERKDTHWWVNEANMLALSHILGWHTPPPPPKPESSQPTQVLPHEAPRTMHQRRTSIASNRRHR